MILVNKSGNQKLWIFALLKFNVEVQMATENKGIEIGDKDIHISISSRSFNGDNLLISPQRVGSSSFSQLA